MLMLAQKNIVNLLCGLYYLLNHFSGISRKFSKKYCCFFEFQFPFYFTKYQKICYNLNYSINYDKKIRKRTCNFLAKYLFI